MSGVRHRIKPVYFLLGFVVSALFFGSWFVWETRQGLDVDYPDYALISDFKEPDFEIDGYAYLGDERKGHVIFSIVCNSGQEKEYMVYEGHLFFIDSDASRLTWVGGVVC